VLNNTATGFSSIVVSLAATGGNVNANSLQANGVTIPVLADRIKELYYYFGMSHDALYAYTSHTFTTADVSGRTGPTLSAVRTAYANAGATWALSHVNMTTQGIQEWTVPATGSYTIRAVGAGVPYTGGYTTNGMNQFQKGMDATITTTLTRGEVIKILVGQIPDQTLYVGGAGGTFVVRGTQTPIIVAGGGGGRGVNNAVESSNATTGASGQTGGGTNLPLPGGIGGSEGGGGGATYGGGGGGLIGDGTGKGGLSFINGGLGGPSYFVFLPGGFGGGGSPSDDSGGGGGGGGGGYSGGGGGGLNGEDWSSGGGGGSYSITGGFTSATANNNANGFVTITANFSI
jgi:hypothetical protein